MMLHIRQLPVQVRLGVHAWEKQTPRSVWMDVRLEWDGAAASASDSLDDTIDYVAVERHAVLAAQARHYDLLEALVAAVGQALLALPRVREVAVEIHKPGALAHAQSVSVSEVYRK